MVTNEVENPPNCGSQNGKAKSQDPSVARIARFVRKHGLSYDDWRYVAKRVRQKCDLRPRQAQASCPESLPPTISAASTKAVDQADDVQHACCCGFCSTRGFGSSELCSIEVTDVDLDNCKIFVNQGKGSKDRYVLFGKSFATALRTHIAAHPQNRWLFQTRRNARYSAPGVQQIVKLYAEQAGVQCHAPHVPPPSTVGVAALELHFGLAGS